MSALVNTLERVPLKNAEAFVAFTGLAPDRMTQDSIAAKGDSPNTGQPNCADPLYFGGDIGNKTTPAATLQALPGPGALHRPSSSSLGASLTPWIRNQASKR
jgi:hypothetical protein